MYGDKVSGGYEAGFVYTEQQAQAVRAVLDETTWERAYTYGSERYGTGRKVGHENMGPVRYRIRPDTGFAGVAGFGIVARTKAEMETVDRVLRARMTYGFKAGERVRTVVPVRARGGSWPVGRTGTVVEPYAGYVRVVFDDEPLDPKDCWWTWLERIS